MSLHHVGMPSRRRNEGEGVGQSSKERMARARYIATASKEDTPGKREDSTNEGRDGTARALSNRSTCDDELRRAPVFEWHLQPWRQANVVSNHQTPLSRSSKTQRKDYLTPLACSHAGPPGAARRASIHPYIEEGACDEWNGGRRVLATGRSREFYLCLAGGTKVSIVASSIHELFDLQIVLVRRVILLSFRWLPSFNRHRSSGADLHLHRRFGQRNDGGEVSIVATRSGLSRFLETNLQYNKKNSRRSSFVELLGGIACNLKMSGTPSRVNKDRLPQATNVGTGHSLPLSARTRTLKAHRPVQLPKFTLRICLHHRSNGCKRRQDLRSFANTNIYRRNRGLATTSIYCSLDVVYYFALKFPGLTASAAKAIRRHRYRCPPARRTPAPNTFYFPHEDPAMTLR
ncbi:hypothetical protein SCHPADRAFT_896501 [Schizopora paradoxa]|uniref:Uncharacterized protein n=1 Tax=Schizopora paradoxa TaxID=27342 RepID=A0A0H2R6L7_9AGAM|nr:hypothetical protein SCHPADRAFT_896501 [Schizopora paradoxa]